MLIFPLRLRPCHLTHNRLKVMLNFIHCRVLEVQPAAGSVHVSSGCVYGVFSVNTNNTGRMEDNALTVDNVQSFQQDHVPTTNARSFPRTAHFLSRSRFCDIREACASGAGHVPASAETRFALLFNAHDLLLVSYLDCREGHRV